MEIFERITLDGAPSGLRGPCGFAGAARFARAEAHLAAAEQDGGDEHRVAFHELWPAPDPDHPLVLWASGAGE